MGLMDTDKTLPANRLVFDVRRDLAMVERFRTDLEGLMQELTKRVRVVNEDALNHLVDRGVIARMARDGCCKPDGGTCC